MCRYVPIGQKSYKLFKPSVVVDIFNKLKKRQIETKSQRGGTQAGCIASKISRDETAKYLQQNKTVRVRQGPCFFGHNFTSARDAKKRPVLYTVPSNMIFDGVPDGATLCQAGFQRCRTAILRRYGDDHFDLEHELENLIDQSSIQIKTTIKPTVAISPMTSEHKQKPESKKPCRKNVILQRQSRPSCKSRSQKTCMESSSKFAERVMRSKRTNANLDPRESHAGDGGVYIAKTMSSDSRRVVTHLITWLMTGKTNTCRVRTNITGTEATNGAKVEPAVTGGTQRDNRSSWYATGVAKSPEETGRARANMRAEKDDCLDDLPKCHIHNVERCGGMSSSRDS